MKTKIIKLEWKEKTDINKISVGIWLKEGYCGSY